MKLPIFLKCTSKKVHDYLTRENFTKYFPKSDDPAFAHLMHTYERIAQGETELKKELPCMSLQATFENGVRSNATAVSNGLVMLDVDHIDNPRGLYEAKIRGHEEELGILLVHITPSRKGLRIVFESRPEFATIAENQQWMAAQLGVESDPATKDPARLSFCVPQDYILYFDERLLDPHHTPAHTIDFKAQPATAQRNAPSGALPEVDAGTLTYMGHSCEDIVRECLRIMGGMPHEGERNAKLFRLGCEIAEIVDFNPAKLLAVMPDAGLERSEMEQIVRSACRQPIRATQSIVLTGALMLLNKSGHTAEESNYKPSTGLDLRLNPWVLPPVIKPLVMGAPEEFRNAVALCCLPLLGCVGSRLRARYQGKLQSPTFMTMLIGRFAAGKSFMTDLTDMLLATVMERDLRNRELDRAAKEKERKAKLSGGKMTKAQSDELINSTQSLVIRRLAPSCSLAMLFRRTQASQGLHLIQITEEIETVLKANKRDWSSLMEVCRHSFDSTATGTEYASEQSFCGLVNINLNTLYSGDKKTMQKVYAPNRDNGTVSRVIFTTLPDQFGKAKPEFHWDDMPAKQRLAIERHLQRLDALCWDGDEVVEQTHEMRLEWLSNACMDWAREQQAVAVQHNDRARDAYMRRAAVIGFRAGMIAYYLFEEKDTPTIRKKCVGFAQWVAAMTLLGQLENFPFDEEDDDRPDTAIFRGRAVFEQLGEQFTPEDVANAIAVTGLRTTPTKLTSEWVRTQRVVSNARYGATLYTKVA